ncbi:hypothetical protein HN670_02400 [bacterium]|jgi:hypothetical protein|nr:hypothetical protein [bacterium]
MPKKITEDDKLEYKSNENYPWEYEQPSEIWVTNFDILKKKKPEAESIEAEVLDEDVEELMEENVEIYLGDDEELEEKEMEEDIEEDEVKLEDEEIIEDAPEVVEETVMSFDITTSEAPLPPARKFSWILASVILFFIIVAGEILLVDLSIKFYWTSNFVLSMIWLWRIALLIAWLIISIRKWHVDKEKVFATAVSAFVAGVVFAAIWKIIVIESVWTWINLLIEPVWMLLVIALIGSLMMKILFRNKP